MSIMMISLGRGITLKGKMTNLVTIVTPQLVNFDDSKISVIRLADNRTIAAQGMGDVLISKKDGSNALLSYVLFVPGMKSNLVSIGQLVEKGFKLKCEERVLELFDQQGKRMLKILL